MTTRAHFGQPDAVSSRPRRKYHHYRPQLHLAHFADDRGRVWIYDRRKAFKPFQQRIQELGGESYLYAPDVGEDPRDDAMEVWLSDEIDGPATDPLRKALTNKTLTRSERSRLSAFIAAQDMRTPKARDVILPLFQSGLDSEYKKMVSDIPELARQIKESSGVEYDEDELRFYAEGYTLQVEKPAWLQFIGDNVNRAAARIYAMGWRLVYAPRNQEFVTNDIGIVKFVGGFRYPAPFIMGLTAGRDRWLVPLSSDIALAISPNESGRPVRARPEWLQRVNRQMVEDAHRFVYSRGFCQGVVDQLDTAQI